ncbi:MAG TPA: hypothetical protein VN671_07065, partial [Solirubrobacterales bacterium]|nr:hypothetical protein [Solirubrobacterales bacterium]
AVIVAATLAIASGGDGSSAAEGSSAATAYTVTPSVRPAVEAEVAGTLEAEGVGAAVAECAGRRVGAGTTLDQLARIHRRPAYAWRWAFKEANGCQHAFLAGKPPFA